MIELTMEQKSLEWHKARSGIVTSTSLQSALGTEKVQNTLMYELISERMAQQIHEDMATRSMQHGIDTEDMAREAASRSLGLKFEATGMLMSTIIKGFGISPDGVHRKAGKINGGIETKCPNSKKHVEYIIANELPKEHAFQFLAPFVLSDDIEWWVFQSFDYRNYNRPEFYIHVDRKAIESQIVTARKKLKKFIARVDDKYMDLCLDSSGTEVNVLEEVETLEVKE